MASCINTKSAEFQTLREMSGLSDFKLKAYVTSFSEQNGRFPYIDELPGANSENYLRTSLDITKGTNDSFVSNSKLLEYTGSNSIEEAVIKINNKHRDLEVDIVSVGDFSVINIKHRPSLWGDIAENSKEIESNVTYDISTGAISSALTRLATKYGIQFKKITNDELSTPEWKYKVVDSHLSKAFIYNGDIYINVDNADLDAPLHELLHMLLGAAKFQDPQMYTDLTSLMDEHPNKEAFREIYRDRTNSDLNEEILISEYSKLLAGLPSTFDSLPREVLQRINYNINRVLDSILFGDYSVNSLESPLTNGSLMDLAVKVQSAEFNPQIQDSFLQNSATNRTLANIKQGFISKGELIELCE